MKNKTNNIISIFILVFVVALVYFFGFVLPPDKSISDIKTEARQASVQTMFDVPLYRVSFTRPLAEEKAVTKDDLKDILEQQKEAREELKKVIEEKIEEAIKSEREFQSKDRYRSYLTDIEKYGVLPIGNNRIILGTLAPKWAKFPEAVLPVCKVEKFRIKNYNKEDVLAISELANVSPTVAKEIVSKLQLEGYSIYKETVDTKSEVKLLWFSDGWGSSRIIELSWSVTTEDSNENLIIGYDPRGILEIRTLPEDKRVKVKAGYYDLLDEFKPKASELKNKEAEVQRLKEELKEKENKWKKEVEELRDKLDEATKVEEAKRDISKATFNDVLYGNVKLEVFWYRTAASGIFLGNGKVTDKMDGFQAWNADIHSMHGEEKGFILTNAHVASTAITSQVYVSKDKEIMWIMLPAYSNIRYTQDSDMYGSPAQVLFMDNSPVMSWDYDCAVMVTSKIHGYNYSVSLGDSDKVVEGDRVVMVGNPSMLQKFSTEGCVAHTDYSLTKSHLLDRYFGHPSMTRQAYNWMLNTNFWFDAPIGVGGTSGSGVWAVTGKERGNVIALHHAGMTQPTSFASGTMEGKEVDIENMSYSGLISKLSKDSWRELLSDYPREDAKFYLGFEEFTKDHPTFLEFIETKGRQDIAGLNAGIKINSIKRFLQERGLDPEVFGWEKASDKYWIR